MNGKIETEDEEIKEWVQKTKNYSKEKTKRIKN